MRDTMGWMGDLTHNVYVPLCACVLVCAALSWVLCMGYHMEVMSCLAYSVWRNVRVCVCVFRPRFSRLFIQVLHHSYEHVPYLSYCVIATNHFSEK